MQWDEVSQVVFMLQVKPWKLSLKMLLKSFTFRIYSHRSESYDEKAVKRLLQQWTSLNSLKFFLPSSLVHRLNGWKLEQSNADSTTLGRWTEPFILTDPKPFITIYNTLNHQSSEVKFNKLSKSIQFFIRSWDVSRDNPNDINSLKYRSVRENQFVIPHSWRRHYFHRPGLLSDLGDCTEPDDDHD